MHGTNQKIYSYQFSCPLDQVRCKELPHSLHHKDHTNHATETLTCQELDMYDRIPSENSYGT